MHKQAQQSGFYDAHWVSSDSGGSTTYTDCFVRAVVVQNERLKEGHGWSAEHLSTDMADWPPFSDIAGKHTVRLAVNDLSTI